MEECMKQRAPTDRIVDAELAAPERQAPQVFSVERTDSGWRLSRRDFLGAALAAAATTRRGSAQSSTGCDVFAHWHVRALAMSPDGLTLASDGGDGDVRFWRLPQGALFRTMGAGSSPIIMFSPDGRFLAAGSRVWVTASGAVAATLGIEGRTDSVAFSSDSWLLAYSAGKVIELKALPLGLVTSGFNPENKSYVEHWREDDEVTSLAITPDCEFLLVGCAGGTLRVRSLPDGALLEVVRAHPAGVNALAVTPDGGLVISGGADGTINLWTCPPGRLVDRLSQPGAVNRLILSADGTTLVSVDFGNTISIWSLPSGKLLRRIDTYHESVALSPDGTSLAVGDSKSIRLWPLPDGEPGPCLLDLTINTPEIKGLQYSEEGMTYTLPCGSPIPAGAACVCNCVPGTGCACVRHVCSCVGDTPPPRPCACVFDLPSCSCVGYRPPCWCIGYNPCVCNINLCVAVFR
jgi:WD40 repeat protein